MATPPSSQKKKARKQRRSLQDSPSSNKLHGPRWLYLPNNQELLVPSFKYDRYERTTDIHSVVGNGQHGGVIDSEEQALYATITSLHNVDIGDHIPIRSDSILIHPVTMATCGMTIACPVLVSKPQCGDGESSKVSGENFVTVCRVWPLASLPLDVVSLGPTPLLSVQSTVESVIKVSPLSQSSLVAGQLELEPRESHNVDSLLTQSFQNYLHHMHDGYYVCNGNYLSVQYYGEQRLFQIVHISPLLPNESMCSPTQHKNRIPSSLEEDSVSKKLSNLSLSPDPPAQMETLGDNVAVGTSTECLHKVYKITPKTKIVTKKKEDEAVISAARPRLSSFAGAQRQVQLLKELVLYPLQESTNSQALLFPHGVLLYGPPGVGKSLLAQTLSNETSAHTVHLSASELLLGTQDSEGKIQTAFTEARERSPCIMLIDDLHVLCPHRNSSPSEMERKSTAALVTCLDTLNQQPPSRHIVVIATTNQIEGVEPSLRRPGRLDREVEIPVPNASERKEILKIHLQNIQNTMTEDQLTVLADSAHGHVGADLYAVCVEAQHKALHRLLVSGSGEGVGAVSVGVRDMQDALREIRPSAMREVAIEVPKVYWSDIGGQEDVKQRMREAVEWPLKHPETFAKLGVRPPRGVLLFGPPGCSKTMVARALATESGLNFIAVKGPELFSKWVGDSERAVRQVFSRARAAAPAIIFFDEIDALAVQRKSEGSSVADRVLAQLLTEMDGVETLTDVLVVAATNRPDMIDKALLRPGRIDRMVYVPLPTDNTRRQILEIQFRKTPIGNDVIMETLVTRTNGYSGAEIVSLCQEAALCAMHEDITCDTVSQRHFMQAFEAVRPQTERTTIEFYEKYNTKQI